MRFIQLRSAPAQNAVPFAARMMTRMALSSASAQSSSQFDDGGFVEGVADVGAIERDACYVAVDGDFQALQVHCIGHGGFSMCATWCFAEHQLSLNSSRDSILGDWRTYGGCGARAAIAWRRG